MKLIRFKMCICSYLNITIYTVVFQYFSKNLRCIVSWIILSGTPQGVEENRAIRCHNSPSTEANMLRPNWFMGIYCLIVELSFECLVLFIHVRIMSLYCMYKYNIYRWAATWSISAPFDSNDCNWVQLIRHLMASLRICNSKKSSSWRLYGSSYHFDTSYPDNPIIHGFFSTFSFSRQFEKRSQWRRWNHRSISTNDLKPWFTLRHCGEEHLLFLLRACTSVEDLCKPNDSVCTNMILTIEYE